MKLNPDYLSVFSSLPNKAAKKQLLVHPDAIPYDMDVNEFKTAIKQLLPSDGASYFYYVKYHDITLISRPRLYWERVRGFFGASNHSKSKLVTLTLLKLAYYGQCLGYDITPLLSLPYLSQFDNTKLQTELREFYKKHHFSLQRINIHPNITLDPLSHDFCFGDTLMWLSQRTHVVQTKRNLAKTAMRLNSSDLAFAQKHAATWISQFKTDEQALDNVTKQMTQYREYIAIAYLSQISYAPSLKNIIYWQKDAELALSFDKNIYKHYPKEIFYYCIQTQQFKNAVQLLTLLTNPSNDTIEAILYLTNIKYRDEFIEQLKITQPDLSTSIAQHFIDIAKNHLKQEKTSTNLSSIMSSGLNKMRALFFGNTSGITATQKTIMPRQTGWNNWYKFASIGAKLDKTIEKSHALYFAEYYFYLNDVTEAFQFILKHPSVDEQCAYILQSSFKDTLITMVQKDSELATKLSVHYLEKAKNDIEAADTLEQLSSWQIDPPLYFSNYIRDKKYEDAYKIFLHSENRNNLNQTDMITLAVYYNNEAKKDLDASLSKSQQYTILQTAIEAFEKAYLLQPENNIFKEDYYKNYQELITLSLEFSEKPNKATLETYLSAINMYQALFDKEDFLFDDTLMKNLMSTYDKTIDLFLLAIQDEKSTCNGTVANHAYREKTLIQREQFKQFLSQAILNIEKLNDTQYNRHLAKLYFIRGDLKNYFGEQGGMDDLNQSIKLVDNNPFYQALTAQVADQLETKDLVDFILAVFDSAPLHVKSYHDWKDERWHARKIESKNLPSIHDVQFDSSFLSKVKSTFGFRH